VGVSGFDKVVPSFISSNHRLVPKGGRLTMQPGGVTGLWLEVNFAAHFLFQIWCNGA